VCLTAFVAFLAVAGVFNYFTGLLTEYRLWTLVVGALLAAFALYHQLMNALERPKIGVPSLMAALAKRLFVARIKRAGLEGKIVLDGVTYTKGTIELPPSAR
jgi:hypothetical protein